MDCNLLHNVMVPFYGTNLSVLWIFEFGLAIFEFLKNHSDYLDRLQNIPQDISRNPHLYARLVKATFTNDVLMYY